MYNFGNTWEDGHTAMPYKYMPKWETEIDQNPDHLPSSSAMFIESRENDVIWVLAVAGLGALVLRADYEPESSTPVFKGVSEFSDAEIGWRK